MPPLFLLCVLHGFLHQVVVIPQRFLRSLVYSFKKKRERQRESERREGKTRRGSEEKYKKKNKKKTSAC